MTSVNSCVFIVVSFVCSSCVFYTCFVLACTCRTAPSLAVRQAIHCTYEMENDIENDMNENKQAPHVTA
jgi:hypothetical protein